MNENNCYHCGDGLTGKKFEANGHHFCCRGCLNVYQILEEHQLGNFYRLEAFAGKKPSEQRVNKYLFLDQDEIRQKYVQYEDQNMVRVNLYLPAIHCSSCIYLLENFQRIVPLVSQVTVNFVSKEALFTFDPALKLSELASRLESIGYEPNFGNRSAEQRYIPKTFLYKLGLAGFAFGSIMLWSFPEYLGVERDNPSFRNFTSYLSLGISIPVLLYSAADYFLSAYRALRARQLNLDVPITIGIIALYVQSVWSIIAGEGPGYMDSFSGFIFFLLIGKWFQGLSYRSLSFERDYTSYFPVAVTRLIDGGEEIVEIEKLLPGDRILIHNDEIIPCDSILMEESAHIDFSFVTGESETVKKEPGDFIYAGGRLAGKQLVLEVRHPSKRSHLTALWNEAGKNRQSKQRSFQDRVSAYFLAIVLSIAFLSAVGWYFVNPSAITHIVVSVLIVTCPCALALSSPFTLGNTMRLLGRKGLYLKNALVIEKLNETSDIVFDKTGTLSQSGTNMLLFSEKPGAEKFYPAVYAVVSSSLHPVSLGIKQALSVHAGTGETEILEFEEKPGAGIRALLWYGNESLELKIGSAAFTGMLTREQEEGATYILLNGTCIARAISRLSLREGIPEMIGDLGNYRLHVLSGDHEKDRENLEVFFPEDSTLLFNQSPMDKLEYIRKLQASGRKVLMIGDGLNDSGALLEAHTGIAVSEDSFRFTPASDAIIAAGSLHELPYLLRLSARSKQVLAVCLGFSILYNVFGLYFAISGQLSPLVAAILMPLSSVTVVGISTFLVFAFAKSQPRI